MLLASDISSELKQFVTSLPQSFEQSGTILYDKRNQIRRYTVDGTDLVVKRYKKPNVTQCIAYSWFTPNKAEKSFLFAGRLEALGIQTPRPLAAVTCRSFSVVRRYYLVTETCDWPSCWSLLDEGFDRKTELVSALAAQLIRMHEAGFMHGDTNLSNFLYDPNDFNRLCVIDINRSRFLGRPATRRECLGNMFRLTHVRPVLHDIITAYASLRGWDVQDCIKEVEDSLHRFETRKKILHFGKF